MAQAQFEPTWATIAKPGGYPDGPSVGKPEMILNTNASSLYHRFSPYSNYSQNGGFLNWGDQPFYYVYIDQAKTFPNDKAPQSQVLPIQNSIIDTQRVSKFLVSGNGITFLATQFLLQTGNAFDETRIYNPTSPIVASAMGLTLGSVRPQRFIDTSNILQSLLGPVGGFLGGSSITPPKSTVGPGALPEVNKASAGKGLLRGGTANKGLANFTSKWASTKAGTNSFMSAVSAIASSLFANFNSAKQTGFQFRSDEGSYGMMLEVSSPRFDYDGNSGTTFGFGQIWVGGSKDSTGIRKGGKYTTQPYRLFVTVKDGIVNTPHYTLGGLFGDVPNLKDGKVGYVPTDNGTKPGYRYEDAITQKKPENRMYNGSDIMYQYKYYADPSQKFPTKDPEAQIADDSDKLGGIVGSLQKILNKIKAASGGVYNSTVPDGIIFSNSSAQNNYDSLFNKKQKTDTPINFGFLKAYRDSGVRMVSDDLVTNTNNQSLGLPTAGQYDTLNTLNVLNSSQKDTDVWRPFKDDLIALYFYDVVNGNYIPFRAAIKGVAESANASWEEMPFIGRADKVYSYGGFTRNLTFNLHIVISSIAELAPTWQRVNYMMTSYKPSNYTKKQLTGGELMYDRFMVPPMFMLTIGDLYRDQPILIQSMVMTVPDDAIWETFNQENEPAGWSYMANTIKATGVKYGQVPREVELGVTAILLEKERAVVGGANFGHAPRTEDFNNFNYDTALPETFNAWHTNYVVAIPNLVSSPPQSSGTQTSPSSTTPFQLLSVPQPQSTQFQVPISNVNTNNVAPPFP